MKIVTVVIGVLLADLAITVPANAQNFGGPFIGVQAGFGQNDVRNPITELGLVPFDARQSHAVVGGFIGYDHSFGRFVLGAEAGFGFGIDDRIQGSRAGTTIDPRRSFDLTARAGYLVMPRTLVYVRGGFASDRVRTMLRSGTTTRNASENRDGWQVGGGVEHKISDRVSARLEYRYADLSEGDGRYNRHQVLTGISYRF